MHLFNVAHWVCVLTGLLLMITGIASRDHAEPTLNRPSEQVRAQAQPHSGTGKRAILVAIGLVAVAYGVSRMMVW